MELASGELEDLLVKLNSITGELLQKAGLSKMYDKLNFLQSK
jgi:hypothetical protein